MNLIYMTFELDLTLITSIINMVNSLEMINGAHLCKSLKFLIHSILLMPKKDSAPISIEKDITK